MDFEQLVMKSREAAQGGIDVLSTGEKLAAALVLNRADWLASMNYTMAEAIERVGPEWVKHIPAAANALENADIAMREMAKAARDEAVLAGSGERDEVVDVNATLVTDGYAPGYRDVMLTFDVQRAGAATKHRVCLRISPEDGEEVAQYILRVHRWAWNDGQPIDVQPGEQRPRWIDNP